jgi:hypothetical protein
MALELLADPCPRCNERERHRARTDAEWSLCYRCAERLLPGPIQVDAFDVDVQLGSDDDPACAAYVKLIAAQGEWTPMARETFTPNGADLLATALQMQVEAAQHIDWILRRRPRRRRNG